MHILTFDIEDWSLEKRLFGNRSEKFAEFDLILEDILETLESKRIHGTFFCTGQMAEDFPEVIKKIHKNGHNIGCHSYAHTWLNKLTDKQVEDDTYKAISNLENLIGKKIISYRAPAFSIGESNKHHLNILYKNGIRIDSSIFPCSRELGGFNSFNSDRPTLIEVNKQQIKEFPISIKNLFGHSLAYSGGGYFRLYPEYIIRKWIKSSDYVIFYFHIKDFLKSKGKLLNKERYESYFKERGTYKNRIKRYLKDNIEFGDTLKKFKNLLNDVSLMDIETAAKSYKWDDKVLTL